MSYDVVVIGGGASGMLSAATAAQNGASVALVEKNDKLGLKLRITGKGRCNLTNECPVEKLSENIPRNAKFLLSAFHGFTPADTMALFTKLGVPLKTERGDRVFPMSDNAGDVVQALIKYMSDTGVTVKKARAKRIITEDGAVSAVKTDKEIINCKAVVLCTGGLSYPKTGSNGDGYKIAEELGHTIVQPRPSLVALETGDDFCPRMQGLSLKNVTLSAYNKKGKLIFKELGEMQFTHFGISGPLVLSASAHMRDFEKDSYRVKIDLKPGLDEAKLDSRLIRDLEKYSNKDFKNALSDLSAALMIPVLVERSGIPAETKAHSVTKEQRRELLRLFKEFTIDIKNTRPIDEAIITSGGVNTKEINPATMESKIIRGLYFAGEIIDADAYTGGHNLQIAWSTAALAGKSASKIKADDKDA